jgi:hypothetical protein
MTIDEVVVISHHNHRIRAARPFQDQSVFAARQFQCCVWPEEVRAEPVAAKQRRPTFVPWHSSHSRPLQRVIKAPRHHIKT